MPASIVSICEEIVSRVGEAVLLAWPLATFQKVWPTVTDATLSATKYVQLKVQGRWDAPSAEDERIAKISTLSRGKKESDKTTSKGESGQSNANQ